MSGYDPFEDRLREVLLAEAQTVTPAGDGLSQIRAKVARRDRLRWLRPGLAVATAAVLAGATVFAVSLGDSASRTLKQDQRPASQLPGPASSPPTGQASPSPGGPVSLGRTPFTIWPYTSLAQAQAAQRSGNIQSWHRDPVQTALRFMGYLQAPEVDKVTGNERETTSAGTGRKVSLGRKMADGSIRTVTVVHLVRLSSGSAAPYAVTVAGAYQLAITQPEIAAPVRSPLLVRGTVLGVDQSVRVEVRTPSLGTPISAPAAAMGGSAKPWETSVSFAAPASGTGTLLARTDSAAGDGVAQIAARPVLFTAGGTAVAPVTKPAADGDIDGDGRPDPVTVTRTGTGTATLTAALSRLGRQSTSMLIYPSPGVPSVMGVVDADANGYAEVFVHVDSAASTSFAAMVGLADGRLGVVTNFDTQARFAYGGTVTHLNSFGCAELDAAHPGRELFVWSGTSSDGLTYHGYLTIYSIDRTGLGNLGARALNVGPGQTPPTGCGSLSYR